jgi:hypothetical protein
VGDRCMLCLRRGHNGVDCKNPPHVAFTAQHPTHALRELAEGRISPP